MAMKNYTDAQKADALAKAAEIGITKAAKELSISVTTLNSWKKAAGESASGKKEKPVKKATPSKKKATKAVKAPVEKTEPAKNETAPVVAVDTVTPASVVESAPKKRGRKPKEVLNETKAVVQKTTKKLSAKAKEVKKTAAKKAETIKASATKKETSAEKPVLLTLAKQEKLISDIATLKAENTTLKAEIARLKKAIADLTK